VLPQDDQMLDDAVVEVIDHRPRARPDKKGQVNEIVSSHNHTVC